MRKSLRLRSSGLALLAAIGVGCAATAPSKEATVTPAPAATANAARAVQPGVAGQIRLADGTPAAGAIVALVPPFELEYRGVKPDVPMVVADAAGRYLFPPVSQKGQFGVTATLGTKATAGYGGVHDLGPGASPAVDVTLGKDGFALGGIVRDAQGDPVKGARVQAAKMSENEGEVFYTTTDAAGHYELQLASDANYIVVADVRGVSRVHRRIDAIAQTLDFRLDRPPAPRPSDAQIKAFLHDAALPVATLEPGKGTSDLAPLKKMIGDAHIVAIGEAVHGASEYWLLRHRLIEFLTTELGFTAVALEAGWSDAIGIDDYVTTGRGDPLKAIADLYGWSPNTDENLAMLRWMRRYNQDPAHTKKLRFRGCDVYEFSHAVPALATYLDRVDPPLASRAREILAPVADVSAEGSYPRLSPAEQEKTRQGIRDILASFESNRAKWSARTSESAWGTARQHARMVQRIEAVYLDPSKRDRGMADTVDDVLANEPKGAKIVVLAHNFHVGAEPWDLSEMGHLLRQRHGSDYFVIGTAFGSGALNAYGQRPPSGQGKRRVEVFALGPPPEASFEAALALAEKPLFAVDLRGTSGPVADWFGSKIPTRWVGGIYRGEDNSVTQYAPKKGYDAVIYVDKISPSHLTAGATK
jgi:erythromycin esterase